MDIPEFLTLLKTETAKGATWCTLDRHLLRANVCGLNEDEANGCCPITFLCGMTGNGWFYPGDAKIAAKRLGITPPDTAIIINAADDWTPHPVELRQQLLTACNLA